MVNVLPVASEMRIRNLKFDFQIHWDRFKNIPQIILQIPLAFLPSNAHLLWYLRHFVLGVGESGVHVWCVTRHVLY